MVLSAIQMRSKKEFLNVSDKIINAHGAVSYETVKQMLAGLCNQAKASTLTIAISGVAGPSGSESQTSGISFYWSKNIMSRYRGD